MDEPSVYKLIKGKDRTHIVKRTHYTDGDRWTSLCWFEWYFAEGQVTDDISKCTCKFCLKTAKKEGVVV